MCESACLSHDHAVSHSSTSMCNAIPEQHYVNARLATFHRTSTLYLPYSYHSCSGATPDLGANSSMVRSISIWAPVHCEMDRYCFNDHRSIVRQLLHRKNPKLDGMLSSRELSTGVQVHGECSVSDDTPFYLMFVSTDRT